MHLSHHRLDPAQREHTFQINEESDDESNAKAQEAYPAVAGHE